MPPSPPCSSHPFSSSRRSCSPCQGLPESRCLVPDVRGRRVLDAHCSEPVRSATTRLLLCSRLGGSHATARCHATPRYRDVILHGRVELETRHHDRELLLQLRGVHVFAKPAKATLMPHPPLRCHATAMPTPSHPAPRSALLAPASQPCSTSSLPPLATVLRPGAAPTRDHNHGTLLCLVLKPLHDDTVPDPKPAP